MRLGRSTGAACSSGGPLHSAFDSNFRIQSTAAEHGHWHKKDGVCFVQMYAWSVASALLENGPCTTS